MGNTCVVTVRVTCGTQSVNLISDDNIIWIAPNETFSISGTVEILITRTIKKPPLYRPEKTHWNQHRVVINKSNLISKIGITYELATAQFEIDSIGRINLVSVTFSKHPSEFENISLDGYPTKVPLWS